MLNQLSKKTFPYLMHIVLSLLLINWVIVTPTFHGIGIYEIALLLLGCAALVRLCCEKTGVFKDIFRVLGCAKGSLIAIGTYLVLGAANVLYSPNPGLALEKYVLVVQMLFVGACILYHMANRPGAQQAVYLNIGFTAVFIAVFSLIKYLFFTTGTYPAIITPERDYNLYSTILLIGWLCAIAYVSGLKVSPLKKCKLYALFTGVLLPMVQVSGSRRSYLISYVLLAVIGIYCLILTVKAIRSGKELFRRAICTLLVCILFVGLTSSVMTNTVYELSHTPAIGGEAAPGAPSGPASAKDRLEADSGFGKRTIIWKAAIAEVKRFDTKSLLIGKGASYSSDYYDDRSVPEVLAVHEAYNKGIENPANKNWMNPHNLFLQDMLDGGIVLLLSLLAVMGTAVFYCIRLIRKDPTCGIALSLMYGVLLFTFFVSSGKGMLVNKLFWLVSFLQILECFRLKNENKQ